MLGSKVNVANGCMDGFLTSYITGNGWFVAVLPPTTMYLPHGLNVPDTGGIRGSRDALAVNESLICRLMICITGPFDCLKSHKRTESFGAIVANVLYPIPESDPLDGFVFGKLA